MQETRVGKSDVYFEDGFQIIMSGRSDDSVCWAGVGFIIAPWARDRLKNFKQICDRMAYVKFTVLGGSMALFCVYAPHNAKPQAERVEFYVRLDEEYRACSSICGKLIAGDLNARLGHAELGEEDVIGQHTFGRRAVHQVELPNRELLLEFCVNAGVCVANTFFDAAPRNTVTFMEPDTCTIDAITPQKYNVLDFVLADTICFPHVCKI